jgi:non-specific serine/threonine protein kinase
VVADALAAAAFRSTQTKEPPPLSDPIALSRRESEVVRLIAQGHTNAQIAATLGMARPTADKHISNILRKLSVSSRADVRAWAIEHGLA